MAISSYKIGEFFSGEFKLVTRRKKRIPHVRNICHTSTILTTNDDDDGNLNINYETLSGKLLEAEVEVKNSSFADNVFHYLKDSLTALNSSGICDILCYGLGHFSTHRSSKYQLALLLSLKKHYNPQIYVYDPVFSSEEIKFLKQLDFNVITINEECKRVIGDNVTLVTSKMKPNIKLLHTLIQEIRRTSSQQKSENNIMTQYILEQARSHRETSEVLCKAREELKNLAETYLCYLNSQRVCKEIQIRYAGKGERSIKETADLVGFKLPHDPK